MTHLRCWSKLQVRIRKTIEGSDLHPTPFRQLAQTWELQPAAWLLCIKCFTIEKLTFNENSPRWGTEGEDSCGGCFLFLFNGIHLCVCCIPGIKEDHLVLTTDSDSWFTATKEIATGLKPRESNDWQRISKWIQLELISLSHAPHYVHTGPSRCYFNSHPKSQGVARCYCPLRRLYWSEINYDQWWEDPKDVCKSLRRGLAEEKQQQCSCFCC